MYRKQTHRIQQLVTARFRAIWQDLALYQWKRSSSLEENSLIWSKGFGRCCSAVADRHYWLYDTESVQSPDFFDQFRNAEGLIWIRLGTGAREGMESDLDRFANIALPTITRPFVLVTTDGDISVPEELRPETKEAICASPYLIAWATQNWDGTNSHIFCPMPIGLDFHTPRPFNTPQQLFRELFRLQKHREDILKQPLRAFCDAHLSACSADRRWVAANLSAVPHITMINQRVSQRCIWKQYSLSPFVISPAGNGLDCHRTWEALLVGSIAITKRSSLDHLYDGLPVVILESWDEVLELRNLEQWRNKLAPLTASSNLQKCLDPENFLRDLRRRLAHASELLS